MNIFFNKLHDISFYSISFLLKTTRNCCGDNGLLKIACFALTIFTLINVAQASHSNTTPRFCDGPLTSKRSDICPSFHGNATLSDAHLKAMEILKKPDVQQMLTFEYACPDNSPGYNPISQQQLLEELTHNHNLTNFILNTKLHKQIDDYNSDFAHHANRIDRGELISKALAGRIDLSQLERKEEFRFQTSILKSFKEIRQAKPGDRDITVYAITNPRVDHNGAYHYLQFEGTALDALKTISERHPIHFIEASYVEQLLERAKMAKKEIGNIKIFLLAGHGEEDKIALGTSAFQRTPYFSRNRLLPSFVQEPNKLPIDKDGTIIFWSCSGGAGGLTNPNNLVNQVAFEHPGRTVIGFTKSVGPILRVDDLAKRVFSFIAGKEDVTYRAKVVQEGVQDKPILKQV